MVVAPSAAGRPVTQSITMTSREPFFREAGTGPGVVCLHSNASNSAQWRDLMDLLAPSHHVLAPDLYGAGKSPDWPSASVITLADEAAFIEAMLQRAAAPFTLVGHSYGAAVALRIAVQRPERVRALVLYEPTLFALIDAEGPAPNDADGIRAAVAAATRALDAGDADAAAAHFIDYWTGPGSFAAMPEARRPAVAASVRAVRRWAHALMTEPTPLAAFCSIADAGAADDRQRLHRVGARRRAAPGRGAAPGDDRRAAGPGPHGPDDPPAGGQPGHRALRAWPELRGGYRGAAAYDRPTAARRRRLDRSAPVTSGIRLDRGHDDLCHRTALV